MIVADDEEFKQTTERQKDRDLWARVGGKCEGCSTLTWNDARILQASRCFIGDKGLVYPYVEEQCLLPDLNDV